MAGPPGSVMLHLQHVFAHTCYYSDSGGLMSATNGTWRLQVTLLAKSINETGYNMFLTSPNYTSSHQLGTLLKPVSPIHVIQLSGT